MRTMLCVCVALACASPAVAQPSPEKAIKEAVQKYVAAFNAGDAEAAAATYTTEGSHTYAFGFTHRGRTEIASGLKTFWSGPMKGARLSITTVNVRSLSPTVAVEEEAYVLEGLASPEGGRLPPVQGLCLAVHQLRDDHWLAAAVQCLVPPPPETTR